MIDLTKIKFYQLRKKGSRIPNGKKAFEIKAREIKKKAEKIISKL